MRIAIYYQITNQPFGGGNNFLRALKKYLENKGHYVTLDHNEKVDAVLLNGGYEGPGKYLSVNKIRNLRIFGSTSFWGRFQKKKPPKLVYRLDGFAGHYARAMDNKMDRIQLAVLDLVDHVIFQSQTCQDSFAAYKKIPNATVIFNGVDQDIFNIEGKTYWDGKETLKIFSANWSANPNKGAATVADMSEVPGVKVSFVGNWPVSIDAGKVSRKLPMPQEELAKEYKKAHIFLHASENDPCPNVVLEALSSGLPVIYHPSGGTQELVRDYGVPLQADLQATVEVMKEAYPELVRRLKHDRQQFSIDHAAEQYLRVLEKVIKK